MTKKHKVTNGKLVQGNWPPSPLPQSQPELTEEQRAKQQKQQQLRGEMENMNGFFTLRTQLMNTLIARGVSPMEAFTQGSVMAAYDFMHRYEETRRFLESNGEICDPSALYKFLESDRVR